MSAPVLVTGAGGWLGSRLVLGLSGELPALAPLGARLAPTEIRCALGPGENAGAEWAQAPGVRVVPCDLARPALPAELLEGADGATLFHCAGIIHPSGRTRAFRDVNVEGSRRLLTAAAAAGVRRAVVMSSNSPCGANPSRDHRFDEDSPYEPYMGYGRSKRDLELLTREIGAKTALEPVLIRAPWFYGPGQPPRQTTFFQMIRRGAFPIVAGGHNLRSLAYVDDLAQGLLRAATTPEAAGQTYWIADAEPYETREIVETVARLLRDELGLQVSPQRLRLPGLASDLARAADATLQACGLYEQRIHVLSEMNLHITCRIGKARSELGFEPTAGLEEGMRRSLRWCAERGLEL